MKTSCAICGVHLDPAVSICEGCGHRPSDVGMSRRPVNGESTTPAGICSLLVVFGLIGAAVLYVAESAVQNADSLVHVDLKTMLTRAAEEAVQAESAIDPDVAPSPAGVRDACEFLTQDDVREATGIPDARASSSVEGRDVSKCIFMPAGSNMPRLVLEITWKNGKAAMALMQSAAPRMVPGSERGFGPGDTSFLGPSGNLLYVLKDDTLVALDFTFAPAEREKRIELARTVVSRLE